jgi:hypothetical protein
MKIPFHPSSQREMIPSFAKERWGRGLGRIFSNPFDRGAEAPLPIVLGFGKHLMKKIVIALGGNAIKQWNQKGSAEEQLENLRGSCSHMMKIIRRGYPIVITHGNGPQVGNLLIQQEKSAGEVPPQPLDVCDAMTQGQIGYMIQQTLLNELKNAGIRKTDDRHL